MSYAHIAAAVFGRPWNITEDMMSVIADLVARAQVGARLSADEVRIRLDAAASTQGPRAGRQTTGAVAVIPVYGSLMKRANLFTDFSGGTTYQGISAALRAALADDTVSSILLDVDSPGGEVAGCDDAANDIRAAAAQKPVVAIANDLCASAAYYLASQAQEVVATSSALVGSIGTVVVLQEASRALDEAGITTTIVRKPDAKYRPNSYEPLDDEAKAMVQQIVDDAYGMFVNAVAKGRGVTAAAVRAGYGQGGVLMGKRALEASLVDRIDTFEGTIARMAKGGVPTRPAARAEWDAELAAADAAASTNSQAKAAVAVARARTEQ